MEYPVEKVEQEFFKRTFKLAKTWESQKPYEVTFLINCLYGIIIVAQASFYNSLNFKLNNNIENAVYKEAEIEKEIKNIKVKRLLTIFRNSLSHFGDKRDGVNNGQNNMNFTSTNKLIEGIIFNNKSDKVEIYFKSSIALFNFICELEKVFKEKGII